MTITGGGGAGPATALAEVGLAHEFAPKTIAHLLAVARALPVLAPRGSVTLVTTLAQSTLAGLAGIAAVNGGLEAAVPVLARELAPRRVNAVSPGVVETSWCDRLADDDCRSTLAEFARRTSVGRNGTAEEVAAVLSR